MLPAGQSSLAAADASPHEAEGRGEPYAVPVGFEEAYEDGTYDDAQQEDEGGAPPRPVGLPPVAPEAAAQMAAQMAAPAPYLGANATMAMPTAPPPPQMRRPPTSHVQIGCGRCAIKMSRVTFINVMLALVLWVVVYFLHSGELALCYPLFFIPTALFALIIWRRKYKLDTSSVAAQWGAGFCWACGIVFTELVVCALVVVLLASLLGVPEWCNEEGQCVKTMPPPGAGWALPPAPPSPPPAPGSGSGSGGDSHGGDAYEYGDYDDSGFVEVRRLQPVPWLLAMAICQFVVLAGFEEGLKFHMQRVARRARPDLASDTSTHVMGSMALALGFATNQGVLLTSFMSGERVQEEEEMRVDYAEILTVAAIVFAAGIPLHMLTSYYQGVVVAAKASRSEACRPWEAMRAPVIVRGAFLYGYPLWFGLLGGGAAVGTFLATGVVCCAIMFMLARRAEEGLPSDYLRRVGDLYSHLGYAALDDNDTTDPDAVAGGDMEQGGATGGVVGSSDSMVLRGDMYTPSDGVDFQQGQQRA